MLRKCIRLSQKIDNSNYIHNATNKSKAVWNVVQKYTSDYSNTIIPSIISDGKVFENPQDIADNFNKFFLNNNNNNNDNIYTNINTNTDIRINNVDESIFLTPVDSSEIIKIVKSLKNSKAVGFDNIRTDIIKQSVNLIANPLSFIISRCMMNGIFPDSLKHTIIKPLHKKGSRSCTDNYRPVALIPILSKVFEKVIYNRILSFLDKKEIISEEQNGFRKARSTSLAAFKLLKTIGECLNMHIPIAVLFLDMSKAFEFVCHRRLLSKLYKYGIRGPAYEIIKSYLKNRTQCVVIQKYCKKTKTLEKYHSVTKQNSSGVPQGSVLGPLLFLLYINDLPNILRHECILFADDTTVIVKGDSTDPGKLESEVNAALTNVIEWLTVNSLKININKTKLMSFHTKQSSPETLNVLYKGQKIEQVAKIKFLGITIDSNCDWVDHIDFLCAKLNRFIYALKRISQTVSKEAAITAYNGYIASALRYGIIIWGNSSDSMRAFIVQKRCVRSIFGLCQMDSCRPFFKQYKLLTLPCLYILEMCLFVHKHQYLFLKNIEVSTRVLRKQHRNRLFKCASRLQLVEKNSFHMSIKIYNKLPDEYKMLPLNKFRTAVTTWLAENCFYSVKEFFK